MINAANRSVHCAVYSARCAIAYSPKGSVASAVRWAITSGIGTIGAHGEFYAAQVPVQMTGVVTAHVQMSDGQSVDRTARVRIAARRSEGQLAP